MTEAGAKETKEYFITERLQSHKMLIEPINGSSSVTYLFLSTHMIEDPGAPSFIHS